jgi:short-subunit dehydrogenase
MKTALISGASGGLARATIAFLMKQEYTIFAVDKSEKVLTMIDSNSFHPFCLDITKIEELEKVKDAIEKNNAGLDLVINFAGIVVLGSVVEESVQKLQAILNVNLLGMYNINQLAFPFVKQNIGRYINISSEYGVLNAVPFHSFYTMSKHAVEVYNDALRREVMKFGITVVKIRPGSFQTNMQQGVSKQFVELVASTKNYESGLKKMQGFMEAELDKAAPVEKFMRVMKKAIVSKKPHLCYSVHNSFKMKLLSHLPSCMQDKIFYHFFK